MRTFHAGRTRRQNPAAPVAQHAAPGRKARGQTADIRQILGRVAVQPKLRVGAPDDAYEREADRVADQVAAMPAPGVRRQMDEEEEELLQTKVGPAQAGGNVGLQPEVPPMVQDVLRSPGQPLDRSTRQSMESRFGRDFSGVSIHADHKASESAAAVGALAYTSGQHVAFGKGQYAPGSIKGQRLLAHELAHVIQQAETPSPIAGLALLLERDPDLSRQNIHTWYVGMGGVARIFAIQVGVQPDSRRADIRFASTRPGLQNGPLDDRRMLLAVAPTAPVAPTIVDESEMELPDGRSYQKIVNIQLNRADPTSLIVSVMLSYWRGPVDVPFPPDQAGSLGFWRPLDAESGWIGATDGYREISANFASVFPEASLWGPESRPFVHPRLGYGYIHPERGFVPLPPGRPAISASERERLGQEVIRFGIHLIPIAGSLVMIGEALVGRSIWGRPLSTTERVILGAGALLAEIGPLIRAGRAVAAATRLTAVARVSRLQALRMVMSSRALTDAERATLARLADEVRAGRALSEADQILANRLVGKMSERLRIAATRGEVEAVTGVARQPGRFTDLSTSISADEARVGQALARDLQSDVVRPVESAVEGVKNYDYLLDDVAAELYSPRTRNIENLIRQAVSKHKQAGVMIIDMTHSPIAVDDVLGAAGRFYGRPEFSDVSRIIFVEGDRVVAQALRPAANRLLPVIIRGAASATAGATRGTASDEE